MPLANSRFADDEIVIEENCTAAGEPEGLSCVGFRQKQQRSANVARCMDNNQTVRCIRVCIWCRPWSPFSAGSKTSLHAVCPRGSAREEGAWNRANAQAVVAASANHG